MRVSKHINDKESIEYILGLSSKDCARRSIIMDMFANFGDGPRFNPYDTIDIPANTYGNKKKNKNKFRTTVGLYIFNKGCIEPFSDILGYINKPVTSDVWEDINDELSYALLENKITLEDFKRLMLQSQIYMGCCTALASSHTDRLFDLNAVIDKKKKKLLKTKYQKRIDAGDLAAVSELEKELLDFSKEYLKDDDSIDMFNSGARSSWGNNFKKLYNGVGLVTRTDGSFSYISTSYMDGMKPEDFAAINDSAIEGPYARSRKTADGGYKEKLATAATQHIKTIPDTDCGTKNTIPVTLTKKNIKSWMYSYIQEGSKTIELNSDNRDKYIGKTVKMRYSSLCQYTKDKSCICEKCMGSLYRRIGLNNIGLASQIIFSSIKLASMRKMHVSGVSIYTIKADDIF